MLRNFIKKLRTIYINRFLRNFVPTYMAQRRLESYVKKNLKGVYNKQEYLFWLDQNKSGELLSETKKRVFAEIPPAEGILRKTQKLTLMILCELDKICKANDINYWIMGGTIIGAVRHKGFIPWDNDVDIGMMRKDYDKLKKVLEQSQNFEILEFFNFNGLYRIPKFVIKNSETKLAIDIILFDYTRFEDYNIPENADCEEKYDIVWAKEIGIRNKLIRKLKVVKLNNLNIKNTELIQDPQKFEHATAVVQKYIDKCDYQYDDGDVVIWGVDNFTSKAPDRRRVYTKESIFPLCELEFEGKKFPAPADYMDMISREAGNIWSFPNDIGIPKYYSDKQLEAFYEQSVNALHELGLNIEE